MLSLATERVLADIMTLGPRDQQARPAKPRPSGGHYKRGALLVHLPLLP